ncbi:MAG: LPP20 family lipoprotein [Treponemataceae bacterium]|nr:LPP20 family lipoprotein [Treponemataceae bacterium]
MKKNLIVTMILMLAVTSCFAKPTTKAPSWFGPGNTLYTIFPRADFMAFRGEGNTEEAAKADGLSKIASNISATISDRRATETRTMESVTSTGEVNVTEDTTTSSETSVESRVELIGLEYSEVYLDKKAKRYYCVVYIDIQNAMRRMKPQIEDAKSVFYSSYDKAVAETDDILSCAYYKSAAIAGSKFLEKLSDAYAINPDIEMNYRADREKIMAIPSIIQQKTQNSTLKMNVTGDYGNIISTAVADCFKQMGFTVDRNSGVYSLNVKISDNGVQQDTEDYSAYAIFPSVVINLVNKSGRTVYSYELKSQKTVSLTSFEEARRKGYPKVVNEIKSGMPADFSAKVGL